MLGRLGAVLREAEAADTEPYQAILAIRLLLLTGCRLGEVLSLRWDAVELDRQCLRLADTKTGRRSCRWGRRPWSSWPGFPESRATPLCFRAGSRGVASWDSPRFGGGYGSALGWRSPVA